MTDEKKPPQGVAEITNAATRAAPTWPPPARHIDETTNKADRPVAVADIGASIVLDIDQDGEVRMRATCFGETDCSYGVMQDQHLLADALPVLLAELREQLKLGRRLTVDESATIAAAVRHSSSGSTVTV